MPFISHDKGSAMFDATPIENMFLLEYLPVAPDDCLRVFFYARMLCQHPELGDGIPDVARALKLSDEAVEDAFRFWEREGLVRRLSDRPPTYAMLPMRGFSTPAPMDDHYYQFRDFNASLQRLFGDSVLHGEVSIAQDWVTVFGLSREAALRIAEYGIGDLKFSKKSPRATLRKIDNIVKEWAEHGVRTLEDAERMIAVKNGSFGAAEAVLKRFGLRRKPSEVELEMAEKWLREWGLSAEDVLDACQATANAQNPSFGYLDKVLENRRTEGDRHFEPLKKALVELGSKAQPTPETLKKYAGFLEAGFEPRTVELAAIQQNGKNRHQFEDLEKLLSMWAELGLLRADQAESYVARQRALSRELAELLKRAGSEKRPTLEDIELYESWRNKFSEELLHFAAESCREKGRPMVNIEKLLARWERDGISTVEAARAAASRNPGFKNPALNYEQRTLEGNGDDLFTDLSKYGRKGE